jgi:hypothetical protein
MDRLFWGKVSVGDGCWVWDGAKCGSGYGHLGRSGKTLMAHRYAYEQLVGPIPAHLCVLHRCDNRLCVNPDHLFLGTHQENTQDMIRKGRQINVGSPGGKNGNAKLSKEQAEEIRRLAANGVSQSEIARRFSVVQPHISRIVRQISWSPA